MFPSHDPCVPTLKELVGVEKREEEMQSVARWYTKPVLDDFAEWMGKLRPTKKFDLIATNPPFKHFHEWLPLLKERVAPGGVLMLLCLNEVGIRGSAGRESFMEHTPSAQLQIAGTVGYRGPGLNPRTGKKWGMDQRSYSWWIWMRLKTGKWMVSRPLRS